MKTWLGVHKGFGAGPVAVCCESHPAGAAMGPQRSPRARAGSRSKHAGGCGAPAQLGKQTWCCPAQKVGAQCRELRLPGAPTTGKPFAGLHRPRVPLCEMSLLHTMLQWRIPRPYLDIKEIDLIVRPLKQAFNSILWGLKTLLNNWAAKRLVISVFIAHIDLSVVNPFKYPCHTGPDGSL